MLVRMKAGFWILRMSSADFKCSTQEKALDEARTPFFFRAPRMHKTDVKVTWNIIGWFLRFLQVDGKFFLSSSVPTFELCKLLASLNQKMRNSMIQHGLQRMSNLRIAAPGGIA